MSQNPETNPNAVAIIGMAGRFPGARNLDEFWRNFEEGIGSITTFRPEELEYCQAKRDPANSPNYVSARSILENEGDFDASFFGLYPKQAEVMDPQHRIFLECAWEALESAGYDAESYPGLIGLYAGLSLNTYLLYNLGSQPGFTPGFAASYPGGAYDTLFGNDKDFLTTRVAHKLNLRGPCVTVQTACSTSLVAAVHAYYSLLTYQCDMALAGGVSLTFPQRRDYLYQPDGMVSRDGTCRSFDADASGTVFGSGAGLVVMKRLADAIADRDTIRAVILGAAMNNDGAARVGYAAPGVEGQAEVIRLAQEAAGVAADSIGYIEAHGTGTPLGDPIEVAALTQAFRRTTQRRGFCALGTAKTHLGHLDMAAGVTGLIKTVLQLEHEKIPGLLNFRRPNPRIDFASSPFFPVDALRDWPRGDAPRRAGVSAFGVGGTNAHIIVEEAPLSAPPAAGPNASLLVVSARTESALDTASRNLAGHLASHPELRLADVAFTLQCGRKGFVWRRFIVAADTAEAVRKLERAEVADHSRGKVELQDVPVFFLFPGQGAQYVDMGRSLYEQEPVFRAAVDRCAAILESHLGLDVRSILYPGDEARAEAERRIHETSLTQPAIFVVEYSLARLWMSWGIRPAVLIGHSIGEYVAAVIAETFTLEDALALLATRAHLMQKLPPGAMLAVRTGAAEAEPLLPLGASIAAHNSGSHCTVSGPTAVLEAFQKDLEEKGVASKFLRTSHAFHSAMMEPMLDEFSAAARRIRCSAPKIRWISTATGQWMTAQDIEDPGYWVRQLRQPVRFVEALQTASAEPGRILLEVGPGQTLAQLARQPSGANAPLAVLSSLGPRPEPVGERVALLTTLGRLWISGVRPDWGAVNSGWQPRRVPLPSYPFERQRFWIEPVASETGSLQSTAAPATTLTATPTAPTLSSATTTEPSDLALLPMVQPKASESSPTSPNPRYGQIAERIRAIVNELSGLDITSDTASFMELGFDSLFLTQASLAFQKRFGVPITFRQLMDDLASVSLLAAHLDRELPASSVAEASQPAPQSSALATTSSTATSQMGATPLEQLLANQVQLMQLVLAQQGAKVTGTTGATATVPTSSQPAVKWPTPNAPVSIQGPSGPEFKRFGPYKPIEKGDKGGLTPRQQAALDSLIARYVRKTGSSKRYTSEHRPHFADPRAVSGFKSNWKEMIYPIVTNRSRGSRLWDLDGNEYVDITMGFGTYFFGHSPDWITRALEDQLRTGIEIGPQSPVAGEIAKLICEFTGMDRATFCNTGSEAVMAAMRLARTVTGRKRIVYFTGDYHGMFEEVLVRSAWVKGEYRAQPIAPGIPPSLAENILVLEYGAPESLAIIETHADEIAGVVVEPVQSRQPGLQPRTFLHELRALTARTGIALIFDEVVTGFRCHPGGAQAYFGIAADLATYGKVVGGGMPIGVLAGRRRFMDALDGGAWQYGDDSFPEVGVTFFAGTFVRHPLALAAAHAVLRHLKAEGPRLQLAVTERVARCCQTLNEWFERVGVPIRLPHFSAFAMIEHAHDLKYASLLWFYLREKGVHAWEGRPLFFTLAHTDEDFDHVIRAFKESVAEMQDGGFLPESPVGTPRLGQSGADGTGFPRNDSSPMTPAQEEIFLSVQMGDEANCAYNESNILYFDGELDLPALEYGLLHLVERHPALRSTFTADGERQLYAPMPDRLSVPLVDLSGLDSGTRDAELIELGTVEQRSPFDLARGPLVRFQIVRLAPDRHVLIFTAHHMVCDGWSFGMLIAELAAIYNARRADRVPLLAPPVPFGDFARQLAREKGGAQAQKAIEYWVGQFADGAPTLELPTDRPRPPVKSFAGSMVSRAMDPERFARLKKVAPQLGGSLFSTLLGVYATLLHRLTSQEDVVIGVPAAGQTIVGSNELIGHCLNLLPIRLRFSPGSPFQEFASAVKRAVLDAYDHQSLTYGTLVQKLKLPRDTSRLPLVSVMFNIDKSGLDLLHFDGLKFQARTNPKQFVNFDLFFNLVQDETSMEVECEYRTDLFDRETIERWLEAFEMLVEGVITASQTPLERLPMLSPRERQKLLVHWNDTAREYPRDRLLHELVSEQAARTPHHPAVRCLDRTLTYAELDEAADRLAARLADLGARRGSCVGLLVDRSVDLVIGLLGILKTGAAYVPLDPAFPTNRLEVMIKDGGINLLVIQPDFATRLPLSGVQQVPVNVSPSVPASPRTESPGSPEDAAYVIFTSGSTGRPKGVQVPHRAVVNFLHSMRRSPGLSPADVLLSVTTVSFDIAGLEIWLPLTTGATVVIATREMAADGHQLLAELKRVNATVLQATPITWRLLLEAGWTGTPNLKALVGGEAVPRELVNQMLPRCREVWNMYGPTETTIWSTISRLEGGDGVVSIGKPIDNTAVYVLNRALQPQPIGIAGELHIGGDGVSSGYLGLPTLTAEKFISDPFFGHRGARLYRTGDLARWLPNGTLECLGRADHQVKIRGFRIELGEIETILEQHPAVKQAIVHAKDDGTGHQTLIGYVVPRNDAGVPSDYWRSQWDMIYDTALKETGDAGAGTLDAVITGWTGLESSGLQVQEWIDTTVSRIVDLKPRRILEIGCGTGQLLARLAPLSEAYTATDLSGPAIDSLRRQVSLPQVTLHQQDAAIFSNIPPASFDTVIINSVAQYFPDRDYLLRVLDGAIRCLSGPGRVFIGDVQGYSLLGVYHSSAQARVSSEITIGELRARVQQRLSRENELSVDPLFFELASARWPGVSAVEIQLRRGRHVNETTQFHYDVILHLGDRGNLVPVEEWHAWSATGGSPDDLRRLLNSRKRVFGVRAIPNARLQRELGLFRALAAASPGAPVGTLSSPVPNGIDAEDLHLWAAECGYRASVRWEGDGTGGLLEAAFVPEELAVRPIFPAPSGPGRDLVQLTNNPTPGEVATDLAPALREHLRSRLPDYMVPGLFVTMVCLPLTANGKVDRKALPEPTKVSVPARRTKVPPGNDRERTLAGIWQEVLAIPEVGITDDFFELGGDSLLSFRVTNRANQAGLPLNPRQLFQYRTIARLAASLDAPSDSPQPSLAPRSGVGRVDRDAYRRKASDLIRQA